MEEYFEIRRNNGKNNYWHPATFVRANNISETFLFLKENKEVTIPKNEFSKRKINIDSRYLKKLGFTYSKRNDSYLKEHIFIKRFEVPLDESINFHKPKSFVGYFISEVANINIILQLNKQINFIYNEQKVKNTKEIAEQLNLIMTIDQLFTILKNKYKFQFEEIDIIKKNN